MNKAQLIVGLIVVAAIAIAVVGYQYQQQQKLKTAELIVTQSGQMILQGKSDKGIAKLQQLLDNDPGLALGDRARALRYLGTGYVQAGKGAEAEKVFARLIREQRERSEEVDADVRDHVNYAHVQLAQLAHQDDPRAAMAHCETVLAATSANRQLQSRAYLFQALAHQSLNEEARAVEFLNRVVQEYSDTEAAGMARERLGELNMAQLLSPDVGRFSRWYTIQPGDNLYTIARANNTTVKYLQKVNGLGTALKPNMRIKVPDVTFKVLVDKSDFALDLLTEEGQFVKRYTVGIGKVRGKTRAGEYVINVKDVQPRWRDPETGRFLRGDDPDYPLGTRWMGLGLPDNPGQRTGLGIHGTNEPETVGHAESAGCVRMLNEQVEELYDLLVQGTHVTIRE